MRILLNVLPEEKRERIVRRFRNRFFLWQTMLILLLEIYYVAVLGGIFTILKYQTEVGTESLAAFDQYSEETKRLVRYQEEFKLANAQTEKVTRYQQARFRWSALFTLLQDVAPEGVVIVGLLTKDYTVSIAGQARTRDQFLAFESALKEAECVSDVRVPISNLFSQKEIDFQVDFKLKRECLINP
jgi:Tfp pilus assembly protein PilN